MDTKQEHGKANSEQREKGVKRKKHRVLLRCGRYALLKRRNELTPYIVACGYDDKTGEWNQGYYHRLISGAAKEFGELSGNYCAECTHVNDGCVICKNS